MMIILGFVHEERCLRLVREMFVIALFEVDDSTTDFLSLYSQCVGPGTYKIPAFNDVPETFNVTLMSNVDNPFAVHSSKAIGEPPFFLGSSVFYAAKEAVRAARLDRFGEDAYFEMRMPGSSERIRMLCADNMAEQAVSKVPGADDKGIVDFQAQGSY